MNWTDYESWTKFGETMGEIQVFWQEMATLATVIMLPALIIGFLIHKYFLL